MDYRQRGFSGGTLFVEGTMTTVRFVNGIEKVIDSVTKTIDEARANGKKKKKASEQKKENE